MTEYVRRMRPEGSGLYGGSRWQRIHMDLPLLLLVLMICGIGLLVLYSASGDNTYYVTRQATFMGLGIVVMLAVAQLSPRLMKRWALPLYLGGILLLLAVELAGVGA